MGNIFVKTLLFVNRLCTDTTTKGYGLDMTKGSRWSTKDLRIPFRVTFGKDIPMLIGQNQHSVERTINESTL